MQNNICRLVTVDLKLGKFQAADKGQMELYLYWLEKYQRKKGEDPPVGLILCAGKSDQHIELMKLAGFCRKTDVKPYLQHSEGEALGVRKLACAFCIVKRINYLKAAAALPHSKAPFGRVLSMLPQ